VSKTKEDEIVTKWDEMREGLRKRPDYHSVVIRIGKAHKRALDALKAVRKAYKPNAIFTDVGEIINRYKDATDAFIAADPNGRYPFPWVTPVKEIGYMGDDIAKVYENLERAEARIINLFRSRDDWERVEAQHVYSGLTFEDFEDAWRRLNKVRRICRVIRKKAKVLRPEQVERLLNRLPRIGGVEITLDNYEMFAKPIPSRTLQQAKRLSVCEAWDCNNVFIKLDGRQKYCCTTCADYQNTANRRFKTKGTYLPKEIYLPIREKESENKWKELTAGLTDKLASKIDENGVYQNGGKRKPVNVKAGIDANVAYYEELNKKQPVLVTRLDFRYPWSRKVTTEKLHDSLVKILEKKVRETRDLSRGKCVS